MFYSAHSLRQQSSAQHLAWPCRSADIFFPFHVFRTLQIHRGHCSLDVLILVGSISLSFCFIALSRSFSHKEALLLDRRYCSQVIHSIFRQFQTALAKAQPTVLLQNCSAYLGTNFKRTVPNRASQRSTFLHPFALHSETALIIAEERSHKYHFKTFCSVQLIPFHRANSKTTASGWTSQSLINCNEPFLRISAFNLRDSGIETLSFAQRRPPSLGGWNLHGRNKLSTTKFSVWIEQIATSH